MYQIVNAKILTPVEELTGAVVIADGRIQTITPSPLPGVETRDAKGKFLVPGFIDLQVNGAFGHDFTQTPETIWQVAAGLPRYGVTSFLPTVITSPLETTDEAQRVMGIRPSPFQGAEPLGLHLEGPFLNPGKKGAHNPVYICLPSLDWVAGWSPENHVRLVTLAPELPGAAAVIEALTSRGVVVSAGHSLATFAEAETGIDAGIRYGTHLFNAQSPLHHREPGLPGALLTDERVTIGLIPDGIHVHPALVKLVWQAGGNRLTLVTDAMAALGMPPGEYELGDFRVTVDETTCRLPDGTLAGSILSLDTAVCNLIAFTGCTLPQALTTVTTIPARLLGLDGRKGQIAPGYDADLVLLTPDLQVAAAVVGGEVVYDVMRDA
ncbi:MAG TPA: N-acetylglucosamine-6-phosphate deacetylase [Anaerolineae bacterium]|nr:N-acetylglucosamine-6-phosphate deacetylase [Anaerolineae bacterium]HIP73925.1 N-acetylglucosamine-6-phosphate deacetylase [Anaerolineae bacterium]